MAAFDYDLGILGGGATGLTAAARAAQFGVKTILVEKAKKLAGVEYRILEAPLREVDRALAEGETEGKIKVLVTPSGSLLGCQIAGHHAGEPGVRQRRCEPCGHRSRKPGRKPARAGVVRTAGLVRTPPHDPQCREEAQGEKHSPLGQKIEMMRRSLDGTGWTASARIGLSLLLAVQFIALGTVPVAAAPKAVPWSFWEANDPAGRVRVDHGPWGAKLLAVQGQKVSLDDIEHRILWKLSYEYDWRVNEP